MKQIPQLQKIIIPIVAVVIGLVIGCANRMPLL